MQQFLEAAGPFIFLQMALVLVVLMLTLVNTIRLSSDRGKRTRGLRTSIDAILFWGSLTAIFGFLGQWSGLYRAANAVIDYGVVNPQLVLKGLGESLSTTVFGMFAFVVAAFLWFALRVWLNAKTTRPSPA